MIHSFPWVSPIFLVPSSGVDPIARRRESRLRNGCVLGIGTFASGLLFVSLAVVGCGDSSANPPYNPEIAKTSAKYKELHPEEFPAPKQKKGARTRLVR